MSSLLTFNCHEAYVHLLGKLGEPLDIIDGLPNRYVSRWDERMRPVPRSGRLVKLEDALSKGSYSAIIAHNIRDLLDVRELDAPKILILHVSLQARRAEEPGAPPADKMSKQLSKYLELVGGIAVAVSEMKRDSWRLDCDVIRPTADPDEYGGYTGSKNVLLRVANHINRRSDRFGWQDHLRIVEGLPWQLVGENPDVSGVRPAGSWEELKAIYRDHRAYIHTAGTGLDDGYNLAIIEAMCTGMPVVSTSASGTPVVSGENGFVGENLHELHAAAQRLLENDDLAKRLGEEARTTIIREFGVQAFVDGWHRTLERAQRKFAQRKPYCVTA